MDEGDLTPPERELWDAFPRRALVDLDGRPDRRIRAEVVRGLLLGARPAEPGELAALTLVGARVTGRLDLSYADVPYPVRMSGCLFEDQIELVGARTRDIDLTGCELRGLRASRATIDGNLRLDRCRNVGTIRLIAARIEGGLLLSGAHLSGATTVLDASLTSIGHDIRGDGGLRCEGTVQLSNADVRGSVKLRGAHLHGPDGRALLAVDITVGAVVNCCEGFTAVGRINLSFASVGSQVCFERARLSNPDGVALACRHLQTSELVLETAAPIEGLVDLRHARLGVLRDDASAWSDRSRLDGLSYEAVQSPADVRQRLRWLRTDTDGYSPQPYEQLAAMYRRRGWEEAARTVLLHGQRHRRSVQPWPARLWGYLQDLTVGYGYRPLRAATWLLVLLVAGTAVFARQRPLPVDGRDAHSFQPFVYTLDLVLPLVDFHQESAYRPSGGTGWVAWALIAAGWVLVTTIAAGATRILRRT